MSMNKSETASRSPNGGVVAYSESYLRGFANKSFRLYVMASIDQGQIIDYYVGITSVLMKRLQKHLAGKTAAGGLGDERAVVAISLIEAPYYEAIKLEIYVRMLIRIKVPITQRVVDTLPLDMIAATKTTPLGLAVLEYEKYNPVLTS